MTCELQQQARPTLKFEQAQRLVTLCQLEKQAVAKVNRVVADLKNALRELYSLRLQIKREAKRRPSILPWDVQPNFHFAWKPITAACLVSAFCILHSAFGQSPLAVPTTNFPPAVYPLRLAWDYQTDGLRLPAQTVIQAYTNGGGFIYTTNRPAVLGVNRVTPELPAGQWTIVIWGTDGQKDSPAAFLNVTRERKMYVAAVDIGGTSNRLVYTGPPMPGARGRLVAWTDELWEAKP